MCLIRPQAVSVTIALAAIGATAQQPVNQIPDDQEPVRRVFPPAEKDRVPPDTEKFILFSREEIGGRDDWDFLACAWEFIPSRPGIGVVKRAEFARSSWSATLAVSPSLGIEGLARNLVLHQVDDSKKPHGLRRHLLSIDFRTWEVAFVGESPFVTVEGGNSDTLLARDEDSYRLYRVATGQWESGTTFSRIDQDNDSGLWLVERTESRDSGMWSHRPSTLQFAHPFPKTTEFHELPWLHNVVSAAREDGSAWAMVTVDPAAYDPVPPVGSESKKIPPTPSDPQSFFQTRTVNGKLWFAESGDGSWKSWPVKFRASPGSGNPWLIRDVALWFEDEELIFQAAEEDPEDRQTIHQWTVARDGGIRASEAGRLHQRKPDPALNSIAAEFREWFRPDEDVSGNPETLAAAFLRSKGLVEGLPGYADRHLGVSADGRRFLWKTKHSRDTRPGLPSTSVLLYFDLDEGTVFELPCPPELVRDNALNIEWVRCR